MVWKLFVSVAFLLASFSHATGKDSCTLKPKAGFCRATFRRWYFDPATNTCKTFIWGGCGGTVPFVSERSCEQAACSKVPPCEMKPDAGPCRARIIRYFFNQDTGACESFTWGGCRGSVPFQNLKDCQNAQCDSCTHSANKLKPCLLKPDPGLCRAIIPRWYYDINTGTCTQFDWGGCGGVVPFQSEAQCQNSNCGQDSCIKKPDPGLCLAIFKRFFYNQETASCESFNWGGCGGSVPFQTRRKCLNANCNNNCYQVMDKKDRCLLEPDVGDCKAAIPRWYFDTATAACKQFSWGGCGGVVPFQTEKECKESNCAASSCAKKPDAGPCEALLFRYFYNKKTGRCKRFEYGGCKGSVPFVTKKECIDAKCNPACEQIPDPGLCKARFRRWYFDNDSGKCTQFIWGGCNGSVPFESEADCEAASCVAVGNPPTPIQDQCTAQPDAGPCTGSETRWYWDAKNSKCATFKYGGCMGTVPFETQSDCENKGCGASKCVLTPADVVPNGRITCQAFWTSWYYNRNTMKCESFSYSGCQNVGPFTSKSKCEMGRCRVKLCAFRKPSVTVGCAKKNIPTWYYSGSGRCARVVGDGCVNGQVFASRRQCKRANCKAQRCNMTPVDVHGFPSQRQCTPPARAWYYSKSRNRCVKFESEGCERRIPFSSKRKCSRSCKN